MTATAMTTDQERIASAKIVYVLAVSGCGKSFTGDYLEMMHGYHHVDGGKILGYAVVERERLLFHFYFAYFKFVCCCHLFGSFFVIYNESM
jgi:hypothetical protein